MSQFDTFFRVYTDYRTRLDNLVRKYDEIKSQFYGDAPCDLGDVAKKLIESERELPVITASCETWRQNTLAVAHKVFEQKRQSDMQLPIFRDASAFSPVIEDEEIAMCENCRVQRCDVKYTGHCSAGSIRETDACICLENMCTIPWCSDCISPELYKAAASMCGINCRIQCTKCQRGVCVFSYIRCKFADDVLGSIALTNAGSRFMQIIDAQCRRAGTGPDPFWLSTKQKPQWGSVGFTINAEAKLHDIHCFNCGGEWKARTIGHYTKRCSVGRGGLPRFICFNCKKTWPTGRSDYKGVAHCTAHCPFLNKTGISNWRSPKKLAQLRLTVQDLFFPELDTYEYDTNMAIVDRSALPIPNFNFELLPESAIVEKSAQNRTHAHAHTRITGQNPRIKAKEGSPYSNLKPDDLHFSTLVLSSQESDINVDLLDPEDFANKD